MPNEDIITGLKNAIERKETLESAMKIMIDSGYDKKEVQEASKFVRGGISGYQEVRPTEYLTMQRKKGFFQDLLPRKAPSQPPLQPTLQNEPQPKPKSQPQTNSKLQPLPEPQPQPKPIQQPTKKLNQTPLSQEIKKIKPKGRNYTKEIILVIILLILIGLLVLTIIFKETIIKWFS